MHYLFAIDVSFHSVQSGVLLSCIEGLRYLLYGGSETIDKNAKIGIMTFDKTLHFHNLKVIHLGCLFIMYFGRAILSNLRC